MYEESLRGNALVSIIMPCFNRENYIDESILSVLHQTYKNWELLVVDDGSSDSSLIKITNHASKDNRIKLITRDRTPKGACTCRNIGLHNAKGKYIIYLDSDDLLSDFCIESRLSLFEKFPENDFLVFSTLLFKEKTSDTNILWNIDSEEPDLFRFLRIDALWQTSGPIYKKSSLIQIGGFKEDLKFWQDFELHLRFLIQNFSYKKFLHFSPDSFHRIHPESLSRSIPFTSNQDILIKRINFYYNIIEYFEKYSLLKPYKIVLNNVLFFFSASFAIDHVDTKAFLNEWSMVHKRLNTSPINYYTSIGFVLLKKYSKKSKPISHILKVYSYVFKKIISDYNIINNSNMCRNSYK